MSASNPAAPPRVGVAIPAAGVGRRMGGNKKPYLELAGEPLLLHALRPFLADPRVVAVRIALAPDDSLDPPGWLVELDPRVTVVAGGATRSESVREAVRALPAEVDVILVHDAARPLVSAEVVDRCIEAAARGTGAVAGWPATDTLKEVDGEGRIVATPERSALWHAQTPQAFPASVLREAYERLEEVRGVTDDASLVEALGGVVYMVEGSPRNLKVTRPDDVVVAEAWLPSTAPRRVDLRGERDGDVDLDPILEHLRGGGVLAYPTETVYGFGCLLQPGALERLRRLKGREADKPMLLLVPSEESVEGLGWTPEARELARVFWPGSVTLVLDDPQGRYPAGVRSPTGGVAVRRTSHPLAARLVERLGEPLTSTSANAPGGPPVADGAAALALARGLGAGAELLVVDVGPLPSSDPSTIVDCTVSPPTVVRSGATPPSRLRCVLPEIDG